VTRLLVVHHTPSPSLHSMLLAVREGASDPLLVGVEVVSRPALSASPSDVLSADAIVLGGPVNLGDLAGALKHFFDQIYYPCIEDTVGMPFGVDLHGNDDLTGAIRSVDRIVAGLRWHCVQPIVEVTGAPTVKDLEACRELGAATAAGLLE